MPWDSALFVARTGWWSVLKKTSHAFREFVTAMDEGIVEYEDDGKPFFPELVVFRRLDTSLQLGSWLGLAACIRGADLPTDFDVMNSEACEQVLERAALTDAQRAFFYEALQYESVFRFPKVLREGIAALDAEGRRALAARWAERPGPRLLGSSVELSQRLDPQLVEPLASMCQEIAEDEEWCNAPMFLVVRNVS